MPGDLARPVAEHEAYLFQPWEFGEEHRRVATEPDGSRSRLGVAEPQPRSADITPLEIDDLLPATPGQQQEGQRRSACRLLGINAGARGGEDRPETG